MFSVLTGLISGTVHVFAGPDHLAAILPLSADTKGSTWTVGFRWGLGHCGGVFLIGLLILLFRNSIPISFISSYSESLVGFILVAIGLWGLQKAFRTKFHIHEHFHNGIRHVHLHSHSNKIIHQDTETHVHTHTAFFVGIIHGLAGSSHVWGVLPALAMPSGTDAFCYLISFGIGTVAAMASFSNLIGIFAGKFSTGQNNFHQKLLTFASLAAIGVGGVWLVR